MSRLREFLVALVRSAACDARHPTQRHIRCLSAPHSPGRVHVGVQGHLWDAAGPVRLCDSNGARACDDFAELVHGSWYGLEQA